jgi:hyperosmotically inducible protein
MKARLGLLVLSTTLAGVMTVVAGCNKPQATGTPPPATTMGAELEDGILATRVKSALLADPDLKGFDFEIETRKGEVQVSGFVDNQTQIDRAIAVARGVAGVKRVENKVGLKGAATTVGNQADDGIVATNA